MSDAATICTKCAIDLAASKRFKDSKGRLFCVDCAARLRARAAAAITPAPGPNDDPDDGVFKLADEPIPQAAPRRPVSMHLCPDCATPLGSGPVCLSCGFNRVTGVAIGAGGSDAPGPIAPAGTDAVAPKAKPKRKELPCIECGYDLTGLKTPHCPECGTLNSRLSRARAADRQTLRGMYVKPLIMVAVGLTIACIVYALRREPVPFYLFYYGAAVPVGFLVYVACSIAFIGFDEPLGVTFVRIAAVLAVADACFAAIDAIPFLGWYAWLLEGLIYTVLLMQVMEIDLEDARIVALVTFIVHIALGFAALWVWQTYL